MPPEFPSTAWRKSSYSNGNGGACVEVACTPTLIGVRDTKNRDGGTLTFSPQHWNAFIAGLKGRVSAG